MGMEVDEAGRDDEAAGVDLAPSLAATVPTAAIFPAVTATSPVPSRPLAGSTIRPPRMTRSKGPEAEVMGMVRNGRDDRRPILEAVDPRSGLG